MPFIGQIGIDFLEIIMCVYWEKMNVSGGETGARLCYVSPALENAESPRDRPLAARGGGQFINLKTHHVGRKQKKSKRAFALCCEQLAARFDCCNGNKCKQVYLCQKPVCLVYT